MSNKREVISKLDELIVAAKEAVAIADRQTQEEQDRVIDNYGDWRNAEGYMEGLQVARAVVMEFATN